MQLDGIQLTPVQRVAGTTLQHEDIRATYKHIIMDKCLNTS
jgi:hypothetical protein